MKVEGRETIALPRDEVWRRLDDPAVLRRCTPGLEKLEETEPGHFEAELALALPAVNGRFTGSVDYVERVEPERMRLRLRGRGAPGFVEGEATLELHEADGATEVRYRADVQVGGQVARLGQRLLQGAVVEMAGQFFEAFAQDGAPGGAAPAARSPLAAFLSLVWRTLLNLLGLSRRA